MGSLLATAEEVTASVTKAIDEANVDNALSLHEATEEIIWTDDLIKDIPVPIVITEEEIKWVECMDAMMVILYDGRVTAEVVPFWVYMMMDIKNWESHLHLVW